MGLRITRQKKTAEDIAYEFRRKNDKISRRIRKLISKSYVLGYISDLEYQCTLGYFYGLKARHKVAPDTAFINTMEHLHDYLASLLMQRNFDQLIGADQPNPEGLLAAIAAADQEVANANVNANNDNSLIVVAVPSAPPPPPPSEINDEYSKPKPENIYRKIIDTHINGLRDHE